MMTIGHSLGSRAPRSIDTTPRAATRTPRRTRAATRRTVPAIRAAGGELLLVGVLYLVYTGSRLLASDEFAGAARHARELLHVETLFGFGWERAVNTLFVDNEWLGVFASYWYAAGHYVVTLGVLIWLYCRHRDVYRPARTALAIATFIALVCYLTIPTAPPRLLGGFTDVLSLHSDVGWWGAEASAPKGLGSATNQLAAFPSMHAGWALWVGLAIAAATTSKAARALGFAYAATTAIVVVGTANHWVIDVLTGSAIVALAWLACFHAHAHATRLDSAPGRAGHGHRARVSTFSTPDARADQLTYRRNPTESST